MAKASIPLPIKRFVNILLVKQKFLPRNLNSGSKKSDTFKNLPFIKNPDFSSYPHKTWWNQSPLEVMIFTKLNEDRGKYVNFLLMAKTCRVFLTQTLYLSTLNSTKESKNLNRKQKRWFQKEYFNIASRIKVHFT